MNHVEFKSILFKSELEIDGEEYQGVISTIREENRPETEVKQSISLGKGEGEMMVVMERVDRGGVVQISGRAVGVNEDQIGTFSEDWLNTVVDAVFGNEEDDLFYEEEEHMEDLPNEQDNYKEEETDTHDSECDEFKWINEEDACDEVDADADIIRGLEKINTEEIQRSAIEESEDAVKQKAIDVDDARSGEMKEEQTMEEGKQGGIELIEDAKKNAIEEAADKGKTEQALSENNMEDKDGSEETIKQRAIDIDDYTNKRMEEENIQDIINNGEVQNVSQDIEKYIQDTEKDLITGYEIDNTDTLGDFGQEDNTHNQEFNPIIEDEDGHTIDGNQDLMKQENDDYEKEDILFVAERIKGQLQPFQDILQHYFPHFFMPQH